MVGLLLKSFICRSGVLGCDEWSRAWYLGLRAMWKKTTSQQSQTTALALNITLLSPTWCCLPILGEWVCELLALYSFSTQRTAPCGHRPRSDRGCDLHGARPLPPCRGVCVFDHPAPSPAPRVRLCVHVGSQGWPFRCQHADASQVTITG